MSEEKKLYQPREVVKITGIETETLRKYTEYFNIITEWTQPNNKGHRRYTKENIELLILIKDKIKNQNWSWKQTLNHLNGNEDVFTSEKINNDLEKKIDQLLENQQKQEEFNKFLLDRLDIVLQKNEELETKNEMYQNLLEQEQKEKKGFFTRIFGK